jgi:HK97 family phage portal protein
VGLIENVSAFSRVKMKAEKRALGGAPWMPWNDPFMRFDAGGPVHPTKVVYGVDQALGLPALYAGTKILADDTASLPLKILQQKGDVNVPWTGPHLFQNPSVLGTSYDWLFACMTSLTLQGNAWGLITGKDGYGLPTGIEWIPPEYVMVEQELSQLTSPLDINVYAYGRRMTWFGPDKELFHVKGYGLPGRLAGVSPLMAFALTISAGQEAQRYGTDWYASGGFPPGVFQNNELEVDNEQAAIIRKMLVTTMQNRQPLVYGRDWDYTPITVPPSEAQFIDAMQLNATHIAAILDLPPNRLGGKSGDSLTYSTVEQNQLQVIEALRPWLVRLERSFSELLPSRRFVEFNTDALLKTDLKTQAEIAQIERDIGLRSVDELRALRSLPPIPGGAGNESLPLSLEISMAQRAGALPKSMMDQVVLLMDLAGKKLEDLSKDGLTKPSSVGQVDPETGQKSGPANDPGQFYANMMNAYSRELDQQGQYEAAVLMRNPAVQHALLKYAERAKGAYLAPNAKVRELVENKEYIRPTGLRAEDL